MAGDRPPCASQRLGAARHGDRALLCDAARRIGAHRDGLRLARPRDVHHEFPPQRRHERRARRDAGGRLRLHRAEPALRSRLSPRRSEGAMSSRREWLLAETPGSRMQARLGQAYLRWLSFRENPLALAGLGLVLLLVAIAVLAPWLSPHSPLEQDLARRLLPPGSGNLLGTDELGRDILSRILYGARTTLVIVALVIVLVAPVGLAVGTVAGYAGGFVDGALMRVTDVFLAFPRLILALAFVSAIGPGLINAIVAIACTAWPPYARIARAETLTIKNSEFIAAARLSGASPLRILWSHVVPLCTSSLVVRVTLDMAA